MSQNDVIDLTKVTENDLDAIRQRNIQKLNSLRQLGAQLDTASIAARRLDTLIDLLLTREQRIQFEYAFEHNMSEVLDKAHADVRSAQLTQGVLSQGKSKNLIIPGV